MSDVLTRLTSALDSRYRVTREVGVGGMARVYLAHDVKHERDVAIKVLHPDLAAALGAERFLAEIKTTASFARVGRSRWASVLCNALCRGRVA